MSPGIANVMCSEGLPMGRQAELADVNSIPVTITSAFIGYLAADEKLISRESLSPTIEGSNVYFQSAIANAPDLVSMDHRVAAIQIDIVALNSEGARIAQVMRIDFDGDCDAFPVLNVNDQLGWLRITAVGNPSRATCPHMHCGPPRGGCDVCAGQGFPGGCFSESTEFPYGDEFNGASCGALESYLFAEPSDSTICHEVTSEMLMDDLLPCRCGYGDDKPIPPSMKPTHPEKDPYYPEKDPYYPEEEHYYDHDDDYVDYSYGGKKGGTGSYGKKGGEGGKKGGYDSAYGYDQDYHDDGNYGDVAYGDDYINYPSYIPTYSGKKGYYGGKKGGDDDDDGDYYGYGSKLDFYGKKGGDDDDDDGGKKGYYSYGDKKGYDDYDGGDYGYESSSSSSGYGYTSHYRSFDGIARGSYYGGFRKLQEQTTTS
jgi:hypothetical protein